MVPRASGAHCGGPRTTHPGSEEQRREHLPRLVSGETIGCFALSERPGRTGESGVQARFEGGKLTGTKRPVLGGDIAGLGVVAARGKEGVTLVLAGLGHKRVRLALVHI